ncbi:Mur ligase domain-containing protein, partial [Vibrio campbellii]
MTGSDANVYPPMSTMLEEHGIEIIQGYDPAQLEPAPDLVVIGNAMSRGNRTVTHWRQNSTIARYCAYQVMKLAFDRFKIIKNIS